jgi:hypothetical protein
MRRPKSLSDQLFRLNRLLSWGYAGCAVRNDMSLADFLNYWLCFYLAQCRHSLVLMPFAVAIEQGKPIKILNPEFGTCSERDPIGEDAVERSNIETQRRKIAREFKESDDEFTRLTHSQQALQAQQEALEAKRVEAIGRGEMLAPRTIQRQNKSPRPRQPFPWLLIAGILAIPLFILIETGQLAWPMLDLLGIDTTRLGKEWSRNPIGVLLGFGMALAATAGLFYLWHFLIDRAVVLARSWDTSEPVVIVRRAAGVFFLCCGLLVCTILIANLRHSSTIETNKVQASQQGQSTGTDMGTGVFIVLTLIIPFTAASLHHTIAQSPYWQRRRDTAAQQARWDRDQDARLIPPEKFADRMADLEQKRAGIEQQLTRIKIERRTLEKRAHAAEQQWLKQHQGAVVFANWLIANLEEKRFYFIQAANKANKAYLLLPAAAGDHLQAQMKPWRIVHPQLPVGKNGHGN